MKWLDMARTSWLIALLAVSGQAAADISMDTALANCRDEAVSTGLVEDADIANYIELCMQAWQEPTGYTAEGPGAEDQDEMQADMPEQSSP